MAGLRIRREVVSDEGGVVYLVDGVAGDSYLLEPVRRAQLPRFLRGAGRAAWHPALPNLLPPLGGIRAEPTGFALVTRHVEGARLVDGLPPHSSARLRLARGVARAVAGLHAAGFVHGALQFSIVYAEDASGEGFLPSFPGARPLDPGYLAPELAERGATPSVASDIFGLGTVIHAILYGVPPPGGERTYTPVPVAAPNPVIEGHLYDMLAPDPGERPAAFEMLSALTRACGASVEDEGARLDACALAALDAPAAHASTRARLGEALGALRAGRGAALCVSGGPRSGRTTTTRWLCAAALAQGIRAIRVDASADDALVALARALGRPPLGADAVGCAEILAAEAEVEPLVVVVDRPDAHPAVLGRIYGLLGMAAGAAPVLGVLTTDAGLAYGPRDEALRLKPYGATTPGHVADALGVDADALGEFFDRVGVASIGDAADALQAAHRHGALARGGAGWCLDSAACGTVRLSGLDEALRQRSPEAVRVLAAAAAFAASARSATLGELAGIEPGAAVLAVGELTSSGFLRRDEHGWVLALPGAGDRALGTLSEVERRALHARIAERLTGLAATRHLTLAGQPGSALAIVEAALALDSPLAALALLDAARETATGERGREVLTLARADVHLARGDHHGAGDIIRARHATHPTDHTAVALARLQLSLGAPERALASLAEVRGGAARVLRARALLRVGRPDEAFATAGAALGHPEPAVSGGAHAVRAESRLAVDPAAAQIEAVSGLRNLGRAHRATRADLLRVIGAARIALGDLDAAADALDQSQALERGLDRPDAHVALLEELARLHRARAHWDALLSALEGLRLRCALQGSPGPLARADLGCAVELLRRGEATLARHRLDRALLAAQSAGEEALCARAWLYLADALRIEGDPRGAADALNRAEIDPELYVATERRRAELARVRGDLAGARARLEKLAEHPRLGIERGPVWRARAEVALTGAPVEAEWLARQAMRDCARSALRHEAALSRAALAWALLAQGRTSEAAHEADEALAALRDLGAVLDVRRVEALRARMRPEEDLDARRRRQVLLLELAEQVGRAAPLDSLLPEALTRVVDLAGCDRGAFVLCDGRGRIQRAVTSDGGWIASGEDLPLSRTLVADVVRLGRAIVVDDVADAPEVSVRDSVRRGGLKALIGVPVDGHSGVIGVLYLDSRHATPRSLSALLPVLEAVARLVGTSIESARLIRDERERGDQIGALVRTIQPVLQTVKEKLAGLASPQPAQRHGAAISVRRAAERMHHVVNDTLALARFEEGRPLGPPGPVDVREVVRDRLCALRSEAEAYNVSWHVEAVSDLPRAFTVRTFLELILNRLLLSALQRAHTPSELRMLVGVRADSGPAPLGADVVRPLGGTCDAPLLPRRDAPFVEISFAIPSPDCDEDALGLRSVRRCVQHLGGRAWLEPAPEPTLMLTLPTALDPG